jgi:Mrp family chromosome partitioning ATPase
MSAYFESLNRREGAAAPAPLAAPQPVRMRAARRPVSSEMPPEYRALREKLLVAGGGKPLKTLVFAGCEGSGGSSEVVRDFAGALASSGLNVLFVDSEGPEDALDLADAVGRRRSLSASSWGKGKLTVVRSPVARADKERLLGSPEFASWLDVQHGMYDYVLLDAPPLLQSADATLLGRLCDGVVIMVQAEVTPRQALLEAREQLERAGVNVVGVVLNGVRNPIPKLLRPYLSVD